VDPDPERARASSDRLPAAPAGGMLTTMIDIRPRSHARPAVAS
jgi:hypothetical protein